MCRGFGEVETALSLAFFELRKQSVELRYRLVVPGNKVGIGQKNVHFSGVGCFAFGIEEGNVNRQKQTVFIARCLGAERGRGEFFHGKRMNVEPFLKIGDIVLIRMIEIDPHVFSE